MGETTAVKIALTGVLVSLSVYLKTLALPVVLLMVSMLIDYATGLMAATHRRDAITSYRSISGIVKKVCHLLLVAVGFILDFLMMYISEAFGFPFSWSIVIAAVIAVWITVNEIISILENIQDIGVAFPAWLLPLVKRLQGKMDTIAQESDEKAE